MTSETVLRFTSRVLGQSATKDLISKDVCQTIRSEDATLIKLKAKPGDCFPVVLQDHWGIELTIGTITITEILPTYWREVTQQDAWRGGFLSKPELARALKRAGYRFKPLEEYQLYKIAFTWD